MYTQLILALLRLALAINPVSRQTTDDADVCGRKQTSAINNMTTRTQHHHGGGRTYLSDLGGSVDQVPHVTIQLIFSPVSCCFATGPTNHVTAREALGDAKGETLQCVCVCETLEYLCVCVCVCTWGVWMRGT